MPIPQLQSAEPVQDDVVQDILRAAGLATTDDINLKGLLKKHRMDPESLVRELRNVVDDDNNHTKMRGIEAGLKLNRLLSDDGATKVQPVFVINIGHAQGSQRAAGSINPILLPRELSLNDNSIDVTSSASGSTEEPSA